MEKRNSQTERLLEAIVYVLLFVLFIYFFIKILFF